MVGLWSPKPVMFVQIEPPVPPRVGLIGNWLCLIHMTSLFEDKKSEFWRRYNRLGPLWELTAEPVSNGQEME